MLQRSRTRVSAPAQITRRKALIAAVAAGTSAAGAVLGARLATSRRRGDRVPPGAAATASAGISPSPAAGLTLDQTIGQLFMVGLSSSARPADLIDVIQTHHAGNLVLFGTGWNSATAVQAALQPLQAAAQAANGGVGLLVSGNQEGGDEGTFQAFYGDGFDPIPSALAQSQGDPGQLQKQAAVWGSQLWTAGVNLDLAPVLDIVPPGTAATNDPIGRWHREYGSDPSVVATYGVAFERGMRAARVAVAIKHFPGLGRVTGNTDFTDQGVVDNAFSGAGDPYLQPYRSGIAAGAEFVMVSLATYPQVDAAPAIFSSVIMADILRGALGFQGLVISDDLGAAAAVAGKSPAERALGFFRAGGDVLLTVQPSDVAVMTQAVAQAAATDSAFAARIAGSAARVLQLKRAMGLVAN
jgi:beta-N-acetylhexosaminidase